MGRVPEPFPSQKRPVRGKKTKACWSLRRSVLLQGAEGGIMFRHQSQKDPMLVEKIMNDLDSNKDNEVDFNEFVVLVAALTVACNDFFQEQQKKKGKDGK
ncbi:protein S100-Z-like isoform X2 [Myxocyprinus asiaticus]|uniref:protein S100-Z-like isoform X2 n=1 Tax=Myxocyprinus asiaticus TaxID=70543 RepID=UPI002222AFAE|nr:protein S100-Z-like isoform X2 [Myxocyprinus asiaticus]